MRFNDIIIKKKFDIISLNYKLSQFNLILHSRLHHDTHLLKEESQEDHGYLYGA